MIINLDCTFLNSGLRKYFLCFLAGASCVFSFAPFAILPIFVSAIIILMITIDSCINIKQVVLVGYLFGFGYFSGILHWLGLALFINPEKFLWMLPFALIVVQTVLALYIVIFVCLAFIKFSSNLMRIYFLACAWTVLEWLRGELFSGFPWLVSGYLFDGFDSISQLASITGIFGLCFLIILFSLSLYLLIKDSGKLHLVNFVFVCLLILSAHLYGKIKIEKQDFLDIKMPEVLAIQSGIKREIPSDDLAKKTFYQHLKLTKKYYREQEIIIWSESAQQFPMDISNDSFNGFFDFLNKKSKLIIGSTGITGQKNNFDLWNSMLIIDHLGKINSYYNKMHLVPFGEYIPFEEYLNFKIITEGLKSYSAQKQMKNLLINDHVFRPLICYESIFSNHQTDLATKANFIINITNDNWHENSFEPYQHFSMSKFRAIEQGIPMIRVAMSGISAVIDSYGRVIEQINLNEEGAISMTLPKPLLHPNLFSIKLENIIISFLTAFAIFLVITRKFLGNKAIRR